MIYKKMAEILLVDDNLSDFYLLKEGFNQLDFLVNIRFIDGGEEAIKYLSSTLLNNQYPDLILLDINLPKKNGFTVLDFIKNDLLLRIIPVIIITNSESKDDIMNSYRKFASSYIIKPFEYNQLIEILSAIINFWFRCSTLPYYKSLLLKKK